MIVNGKQLAEKVYASLPRSPLTLGILVGGKNPVTDSFVSIKEKAAQRLGVSLVREELQADAKTEDAVRALRDLASRVDGIIVQLPLPPHFVLDDILREIPPEKDVDGISPAPRVRPPVAEAVKEILAFAHVVVQGKRAVVVGSGRLVGAPCAALLREMGAEVTVVERGDSLQKLNDADIIVLGAGEAGIVKPEMLTPGVVLIDAGTSEVGGRVAGDAEPGCAEKASVFTPVPGGVGPLAVSMIFKNLFALAKK